MLLIEAIAYEIKNYTFEAIGFKKASCKKPINEK